MTRPIELVFTCEHASSELPPRAGTLGVSLEQLQSHVSWDPGALSVVRALAARFEVLPFTGSYSRMLVDLNRGVDHPDVIPARSFGVPVPGNQDLDPAERRDRMSRFHAPYRRAIERAVRTIVHDGACCLLISVHSFTPVLDDEVRTHEAGVLFDDTRPGEREIAHAMLENLRDNKLDVLPNYPYPGTGSGVYSELRQLFPATRYAGIEIETRFDELRIPPQIERFVDLYEAAIRHGLSIAAPSFASAD